jgi:histidyl-tRNA synthetase
MRDFMGPEMLIRDYLISTAIKVFELFGYQPLDTPVMELWETLSAKGGEEIESETFTFKDKGNRDVGLRFDLTVPLARIVATNPHLPKPFKRYAVGKAWRYDRPQAGRYREFMQADVDVIGSASAASDAEVALVALEFMRRTLEANYSLRINNRKVLKGLTEKAGIPDELAFECFRAIDKLDKIGQDGVLDELKNRGIDKTQSDFLIEGIALSGSGEDILLQFKELLDGSKIGLEGVDELLLMASIFRESGVEDFVEFDMSLARGLDYYTGPVFEGKYNGKPDVGAIGGGGRYDNLIEKFGGQSTPATGYSLGVDRFVDILLARNLASELQKKTKVFVAPIKQPMVSYAMRIQNSLVQAGISSEVDLMGRPLKKQLEQADTKGSLVVVIVGQRDIESGTVSVRDMKSKETKQVPLDEVVQYIQKQQ